MAFVRVVDEFFIELTPSGVAATAHVEEGASIGLGVYVGEHSVIGSEASIGTNTRILHSVVVTGHVEIGRNCVIKHNATIGSQAFSFVTDAAGVPLLRPHIGRIVLGDNVWIGAGTCIENPALDDTSIGNSTKVDDLVQIGHDCRIGERCLITAGAILSHHVHVGDGAHIGPNASVRENVRIGRQAMVGIGAVVLQDIEDGSTYVGNPARRLRPNRA
jgi:UDP-3-O-[3-hydroxymyristoyl] glucosamine N-acyltransferase